jgi:hypothetical protein
VRRYSSSARRSTGGSGRAGTTTGRGAGLGWPSEVERAIGAGAARLTLAAGPGGSGAREPGRGGNGARSPGARRACRRAS